MSGKIHSALVITTVALWAAVIGIIAFSFIIPILLVALPPYLLLSVLASVILIGFDALRNSF